MARSRQELYDDLKNYIRSGGQGGKTTAQDVRSYLSNMLDTVFGLLDSKADTSTLTTKVDKVAGKQLSTEDYTTTEKQKLAGVAANANNYVHPSSHPASIITQTSTARFVTDAEKAAWNAKLGTTGGSVTGDLAINKANAWLTLKSWDNSQGGTDANEQGAGISIGESGYKGGAALHMTYTGDGWANIGMGVVGANGRPQYNVMRMYYERNTAEFQGSIRTPDNSGGAMYSNYSGTNWFKPQDEWGNMHLKLTDGAKGMYFDAGAFYFRNAAGSGNSGVSISGNTLTINKAGTTESVLAFPAQANDPGYIKHIENNNAAEMRFSVSDDNSGDYFTFGSSFNGWTEAFRIHTNGDITARGNVTAFSDASVKTNIRSYEGGLAKVMQLKPSVYNRTDIQAQEEMGFIAQEVQQVEPSVVKGEETLSLDYSRIVVMLTKALQEQQQQIEKQNNDIQDLLQIISKNGLKG